MSFKLVQVTDTHLFKTRDQKQKGVNTSESLRKVVSDIAANHPEFDALLLTGDLSQDESPESYRLLEQLLAPVSTAPVHAIPGNHDDLDTMRGQFDGGSISVLSDLYLGNWRIVMLDSHVPGCVHGEIGVNQINALDASLNVSSEHTMIAVHHPPMPVDSAWIDASCCQDGDALLDLAAARQARAVVCGHVHQEFETTRDGVVVLATPSTCVQFAPRQETFAIDDVAPGYRLLNLAEDGTWSTHVVRIKNK